MVHARFRPKVALGSTAFTIFLGVALGLVADTRDASAQIPSNGVFYACVRLDKDQDEGRLARLVAADEACKPKETRVQWGMAGPQGPQGPKGATGATGATGANGTNGLNGATGATGATGDAGPKGATGSQGLSVQMSSLAGDAPECSGRGGTKLILVDGQGADVGQPPQFVCDGARGAAGDAGPPGPAGTTSQSSTTYFSTALKSANTVSCDWTLANATQNVHPGFPVTITVPANVDVLIQADGANLGSNVANSVSTYSHFLVIDNSRGSPFYATKQTSSIGNGSAIIANWSFARRVSLTPGSHQIGLCSLFVSGNALSNYAGPTDSPLQSSITVTFIAR